MSDSFSNSARRDYADRRRSQSLATLYPTRRQVLNRTEKMSSYIKISSEFGEEECEVPLEDDGTLLLTTLQSIFPLATGLKFRGPTNCYRVVKICGDSNLRFHPPGLLPEDSWDSATVIYICVFPPKSVTESKPEEVADSAVEKIAPKSPAKAEAQPGAQLNLNTVDLIVLNLSLQTSELDLRNYFESKFGPLLMGEIKRDRKTGSSRRFAFIRFKNYKDQMKAINTTKHKIDGQLVRVALPDYRDPSELYQENKCFVGRVNEAIKSNDLKQFFSQFGEIVEVSYPKKFKGYAFVTFADADIARKICGQDFVIKGYSVCVSKSTNGSANKQAMPAPNINPQYGGGYQNDWNSGWFSNDSWSSNSRPYVTAPLNPQMNAQRNASNFYGNSSGIPSMSGMANNQMNPINVLSMAMGNLLNNQMGPGNVSHRLSFLKPVLKN